MLLILSPAKSLDYETKPHCNFSSEYRFIDESKKLVDVLKNFKPDELENLMGISSKLSELNYNRFQSWIFPFEKENSKQALFAFKGDVYSGLDAYSLNNEDIEFAQNSLRILSGLYGLLRPLDLILPYRLEMSTKLKVNEYKNLYEFWENKIGALLNNDLEENNHKVLLNLASNEYFKSIVKKNIKTPIISPEFKNYKNGQYKTISIYAKKARGLMTRFIIKNNISNPEDLKAFDLDGYYFNNQLSSDLKPVFTRDH